MAVDMFLKLDTIEGESADDKHGKEIDVLSWSWGATQSGTAHTGGGSGAGKASIHDLTVSKYVDKASPLLASLCWSGLHIKSGVLTVRKAGGKAPLEYFKISITDLMITSQQVAGSSHDDRLTETVSINFATVKVEYVPQKADGSGGPSITKGWDIAKNKEAS
jgi:type VI secretion system secreted protein Hcp